MKLLFDHNLNHKLVRRLADIFPDSMQTRLLNFSAADDPIIWLRCGKSTVAEVERLLRANLADIGNFESHPTADVLEIWP